MSDLRKMARDAGFNTEFDDYVIDHWKRFEKLAELIKDAALAQPEQEPVLHKWAALFEDPNNDWQAGYESARRWVLEVGLQSVAAPPQRKPLTEGEIDEIIYSMAESDRANDRFTFARAIEAAHGIGGET